MNTRWVKEQPYLHVMWDCAKSIGAVTTRKGYNGWTEHALHRQGVQWKMLMLSEAALSPSVDFRMEYNKVLDWAEIEEIRRITGNPLEDVHYEWIWNTADLMTAAAQAIRERIPLGPKTPQFRTSESKQLANARDNVRWEQEEIAQACAACNIRQLWLAGAVLQEDYCDLDDFDLVYEQQPGQRDREGQRREVMEKVFGPHIWLYNQEETEQRKWNAERDSEKYEQEPLNDSMGRRGTPGRRTAQTHGETSRRHGTSR